MLHDQSKEISLSTSNSEVAQPNESATVRAGVL